MKGKYIILLTILVFIGGTYFFVFFKSKKYSENYLKMCEYKYFLVYTDPFLTIYQHNNFQFPRNINNFLADSMDTGDSMRFVSGFIDFLSLKKDKILVYYPLFNDTTSKFDSYIIISGGIDGKFNNSFNENDTVLKGEIFKKFDFYNEDCWQKFSGFRECDSVISSKFDILKFCFGKKDYLVYYLDNKNRTTLPPSAHLPKY